MKDKLIVILSGEIAAGKTTLAEKLSENFDFKILKTREALEAFFEKDSNEESPDRSSLQKFGEQLDVNSNGGWVMKYFQSHVRKNPRVIIDSARIKNQIDAFRDAYGYHVVHIHLKADAEALLNRFIDRGVQQGKYPSKMEALKKYGSYKSDKTESGVNQLDADADLVIDTSIYQNPDDTFLRASSFLKLLAPIDSKLVDVIVGGQFGSEGKGQVAAYLAPEYDGLIRVGGPNAGHKVFHMPTPDTFHLIPSGSRRASNAKIIIGPGAVLSEEVLLEEIQNFGIERERLIIDENATIISEDDKKWEAEFDGIGSTKQGVGKATAENILNRIKGDNRFKAANQRRLKGYIGCAHDEYERFYAKAQRILLEGTQGTFLSIHHGFYPHVTSRDTTVSGCISEAGISPMRVRKIIMVVRRYPIRVQNPETGTLTSGGFYSREITLEDIADKSGISIEELQKIETTSTTKKKRRIAEFNWALFRKACELNSPTDVALTFSDYISIKNRDAMRYSQLTPETMRFVEEMERCSGVPTSLIATEFSYRAIIDRRNW
jgi:adenylosuccinate synthase